MLEWLGFGLSLFGFVVFNATFRGVKFEDGVDWLFLPLLCHAATFIALILMLFVFDDALFRILATAAFLIGLFLSSRNHKSALVFPFLRNFINFSLPFALCLVAAVEANVTYWRPELRAAQLISFIACFAVVISFEYGERYISIDKQGAAEQQTGVAFD